MENVPIIEFKNVSFSYGDEGESAIGISFQLYKGEMQDRIGTELESLQLQTLSVGFMVTQGEVMLYGRNVKDYNLDSLRKSIGIVPQISSILCTIIENIGGQTPMQLKLR